MSPASSLLGSALLPPAAFCARTDCCALSRPLLTRGCTLGFSRILGWRVLLQWAALGVVGAVLEDSVLQLSLFCAMHTVSFLLLVVLKPFANW